MIVDKNLELSDSQELSGAEAASDEVVDLGQEYPTPGIAQLECVVTLEEGFTGTVTPKLQTCDTEDGDWVDVAVAPACTPEENGAYIVIPVPQTTKRFLRAYYEGSGSGKVNAVLTWGTDSHSRVEAAAWYMR